ncbi:hypothetical protein [Ruegeria marisrubri]|uniref:hypothetical protein n=1 Tax=Ruegeria marisrubri TaxID=1685379 RepID=UPI0012FDFFBB|nr:hypothetical protein [Ruegeria marisrubri]
MEDQKLRIQKFRGSMHYIIQQLVADMNTGATETPPSPLRIRNLLFRIANIPSVHGEAEETMPLQPGSCEKSDAHSADDVVGDDRQEFEAVTRPGLRPHPRVRDAPADGERQQGQSKDPASAKRWSARRIDGRSSAANT